MNYLTLGVVVLCLFYLTECMRLCSTHVCKPNDNQCPYDCPVCGDNVCGINETLSCSKDCQGSCNCNQLNGYDQRGEFCGLWDDDCDRSGGWCYVDSNCDGAYPSGAYVGRYWSCKPCQRDLNINFNCGDGICDTGSGETYTTCYIDCSFISGNGVCEAGETVETDPSDCDEDACKCTFYSFSENRTGSYCHPWSYSESWCYVHSKCPGAELVKPIAAMLFKSSKPCNQDNAFPRCGNGICDEDPPESCQVDCKSCLNEFQWIDDAGHTCSDYVRDNRCGYKDNCLLARYMKSADYACCACGGGSTGNHTFCTLPSNGVPSNSFWLPIFFGIVSTLLIAGAIGLVFVGCRKIRHKYHRADDDDLEHYNMAPTENF